MKTRRGFTLIELLTVMGIMVLMAGGIGLSWRTATPTLALDSAQAMVAALLDVARNQAASNQNRAMLVVDAQSDDARFLRAIYVAVETAPNSGHWWINGGATMLPQGIFIVPGSGALDVAFGPVDGADGAWPAARHSTLLPVAPDAIIPIPENPPGKYLGMTAPLSISGAPEGGGMDKLVLAQARRNLTTLVFDHPESVRGVAVGGYGVAILINDGPGLDF